MFSLQGILQIVYSVRVTERDFWGTISLVSTWTCFGLKIAKVYTMHESIHPFRWALPNSCLHENRGPCEGSSLLIAGSRAPSAVEVQEQAEVEVCDSGIERE